MAAGRPATVPPSSLQAERPSAARRTGLLAVSSWVSFALGVGFGLLSGRVAYGLGLAVGMLALLAVIYAPPAVALALAALTTLASPVAGAFLALAGLAYALASILPSVRDGGARGGRHQGARACRRGSALAAAALLPALGMTLAFPEGGWQPFAPGMFWPVLAGVVLTALALPRFGGTLAAGIRQPLTWGAWLYALALVGAFALHTPVGDNAVRLGALLGAPLAVGALWQRRRLVLALLAPVLLSGVGADSFTLRAPRPGAFTVRVRFTPYWTLLGGRGSVHRATGGWTEVDTRRAGVIRVGIEFA
ncbi:MAG: hypothetical protein ACLP1Q_09295 [Solirubrobacteraceae bacterium]